MFKKIEIWILYLVLLVSILFAVGFGVLVRQELVGETKAGWISKTALTLAEIPVNLKKLVAGTSVDFEVVDRFPGLDGFDGVPNDNESYLLLSRYDGDLQEGIVELVDLTNFEVLHTWNPDINAFNKLVEAVDEYKYIERDQSNARMPLIHPKLTKDGGLLINAIRSATRKIDSCSRLIFQNTRDIFHHSIETDSEGNIWVPSQIYPQTLPLEKVGREFFYEGGFHDDAIVKLSADGRILFEKSVSQILIDNGLEYLLFSIGDQDSFGIDPVHLNDIQPVDSDGEYWKKGDVFLSLRHQSMVLLYRPFTNKIIWKGVGPLFHQHDVDILDKHRVSIFNNNSKDFIGGDSVDGHNEVVIYDFKTKKYSSYLSESLFKFDVRTVTNGRSEILENGDLIIEETNFGRTMYINTDGTLRWSHVNRAGNGNVYGVGWSRILHKATDIEIVNNFLRTKGGCNG
tara:strand:+ start:582 stop:1952 length:1371 start_codon:yes stop_codon:yes gene_type:complete